MTTIVRKLTVANRDTCLGIVSISLTVLDRLRDLLVGCSCGHFSIPASLSVTVLTGGELEALLKFGIEFL